MYPLYKIPTFSVQHILHTQVTHHHTIVVLLVLLLGLGGKPLKEEEVPTESFKEIIVDKANKENFNRSIDLFFLVSPTNAFS